MEKKCVERIRRKLVKNSLETIFLAELRNKEPLGACELSDIVHSKFGFTFSAGTVYGLLYSMERQNLVTGEAPENKRTYRLTQKGRETIDTVWNSREEIWELVKIIF